jgi:hypothetical protein
MMLSYQKPFKAPSLKREWGFFFLKVKMCVEFTPNLWWGTGFSVHRDWEKQAKIAHQRGI